MKLYVFETDKWLESDVVYPHDIALCLHSKKRKVYVWEGPRITPETKKQANEALGVLKQKFSQFTIEEVDESTPQSITKFINLYVNTSFEEGEQIDREPQYVVFYYMLMGLLIVLAFAYFMIFRIIGWERVSGTWFITISYTAFANWAFQNYVILIVLASLFIVALVFAGLTQKIFLIITASVGIIVLTGTVLYFRLGVYLFDFKPGAPIGYYYISLGAAVLFFFLNLIALGIIVTPMIISLGAIRKTTTPISWEEWKEKRKKSVVEMKKFSILDVMSEFTEVEQEISHEESSDSKSNQE